MKRRLAELLCCPVDRTPLELVAWESDGDEIVTGLLVNRAGGLAYPIHEGVPRMLVFRTGVATAFLSRHASRFARDFPNLRLPDRPSMPGEEDVLRTFSSEWVNYQWDDRSYWNLTPRTWFQCMRYVLDLERRPIRGRLVLEAGIGIGGVADFNAREEGAEVVGMDLGYAVDAAFRQFGRNPALHIVQASVFAPPFPAATFDLVYSFGVIHHTSSPRAAFDSLATLPGDGGRLYIWVYHPANETRTPGRRVLMKMEQILRPFAWRLPENAQAVLLAPLAVLYVVHQAARVARAGFTPEEPRDGAGPMERARDGAGFTPAEARGGDGGVRRSTPAMKGQVRYGWREAMHAARDRFTPRYASRHTEVEVGDWFRAAGYADLRSLHGSRGPDFLPESFLANTSVDGVRRLSDDSASVAEPAGQQDSRP